MNTIIRLYKNSDLSDLLTVWESATKLAHPFFTESFLEQERYNIPNIYLPNANTWVVVGNNNIVGFIALIGNEVGALFVDPNYHGQGLGTTLMNKAQSLHSTLEVDVFKKNHIGRRFYDHYGFRLQSENIHEDTGNKVLRLLFEPKKIDVQ